MTGKILVAALLICAFSLLVWLARSSWIRRIRTQEELLPIPLAALNEFGPALANYDIQYVATTEQSNHLERINAYGLGFRGEGRLCVFDNGLLILREGERSLAIPRADITDLNSVNVSIDRGVESRGLITVEWNLQDLHRLVKLSTFLRFGHERHQSDFLALLVDLQKAGTK